MSYDESFSKNYTLENKTLSEVNYNNDILLARWDNSTSAYVDYSLYNTTGDINTYGSLVPLAGTLQSIRRLMTDHVFRLGLQEKRLDFNGYTDGQVIVPDNYTLYSPQHIRVNVRTVSSNVDLTLTLVRYSLSASSTPEDLVNITIPANKNYPTSASDIAFVGAVDKIDLHKDDVILLKITSTNSDAENLSLSLTSFITL